jgi:hypothetical protein
MRQDVSITFGGIKSLEMSGRDATVTERRGNGARRWLIALVILVAGTLLALMVFLHLSGTLGPGIH